MFDLSGKTALVTGATGGIGGAIARSLHAQGAHVVLSGTRGEVLADIAAAFGGRVSVAAANLSDAAVVDGLIAQAEDVAGNPIDILVSPQADSVERLRLTKALGLDLPLWRQYLRFLDGVAAGDFGISFVYGQPALRLILERMPATFELAGAAMVIAVGFGIPLGLYAGLRPESPASRLVMGASLFGFSLPAFWVGLLYDEVALDGAWELVKGWSAEERQRLRDDVPRHGLAARIGGRCVRDIATDALQLAHGGLKRRARTDAHGRDETRFLDPLFAIVDSGRTQADDLIALFDGPWAGSVTPVFEARAY